MFANIVRIIQTKGLLRYDYFRALISFCSSIYRIFWLSGKYKTISFENVEHGDHVILANSAAEAYVNNNPVNGTDPSGHYCVGEACPDDDDDQPVIDYPNDPLVDPEYSAWRTLQRGSMCSACHVTHDGYLDDGRIPDNSKLDQNLVNRYRNQDDLAFLVHAGIGLAGSLGLASASIIPASQSSNRAVELHNALRNLPNPQPYNMRTTAVLTTEEGVTLVSSSGATIDPIQRSLLATNEVEVLGQAGVHAEQKLVIAASSSNLTPNTMYVSRPVCPACQRFLSFFNIPFIAP